MWDSFPNEYKDKGLSVVLGEHGGSVEAVMNYVIVKGYYSPNSKLAYLKNELIRVKNQKVSQTDYYKENMYLLQEIKREINRTWKLAEI